VTANIFATSARSRSAFSVVIPCPRTDCNHCRRNGAIPGGISDYPQVLTVAVGFGDGGDILLCPQRCMWWRTRWRGCRHQAANRDPDPYKTEHSSSDLVITVCGFS
jgi:hypothetical protein